MADEKNQPKPFANGILSQTTGRPGDTVQRSYNNEVVKGRLQSSGTSKPSGASQTTEKKG